MTSCVREMWDTCFFKRLETNMCLYPNARGDRPHLPPMRANVALHHKNAPSELRLIQTLCLHPTDADCKLVLVLLVVRSSKAALTMMRISSRVESWQACLQSQRRILLQTPWQQQKTSRQMAAPLSALALWSRHCTVSSVNV